jgi:dihydrofolate reductase
MIRLWRGAARVRPGSDPADRENKMRRLIVSIHTTMDGIVSGPEEDPNNLEWALPGVEDTLADVSELLGSAGAILMGRVTYEGLATFWPTETGDFAEVMNKTPKIVFSHSPREVAWGQWETISLVHGDVADAVRAMKAESGPDLVTVGSPTLIESFTNLGLINEYRITVHPALLGSGRRLFRELDEGHTLRLVRTKAYARGAVLVVYEALD